MSDFQNADQTWKELDPFQRVKYSVGLVLGADEFEQEQSYFRERDHLHHRALHGYGTVSGLRVTASDSVVTVSPGVAVDPQGRPVRVKAAQRGDLAEWLRNPANAQTLHAGVHGHESVFVTLTYTEADANPVPIPGPAGRPGSQAVAYSRVVESGVLSFSALPPSNPDDEAIRRLGHLLARLRPAATGEGVTPHRMEALVRSLAVTDDPLPGGGIIPLRWERADAVMQAAFRVWATEVRPALQQGRGSAATDLALLDPDGEPENRTASTANTAPGQAVLLARVDFMRNAEGTPCHLNISEEGRPFLLPTHLLQAYMTRQALFPTDLLAASLQPAPACASETDVGGDLTGTLPEPTVARLQGRPVSNRAPSDGAVLTWSHQHGQWEPQLPASAQPAPGSGALPVRPLVTVTRLAQGANPAVELWFHCPEDVTALHDPFELRVSAEVLEYTESLPPGGVTIGISHMQRKGPNRLIVVLDDAAAGYPHLRFEFRLLTGRRQDGRLLARMLSESGWNWLGYDGRSTIVAFHHHQPLYEVAAAGIVERGQVVRGVRLTARERSPGVYLLSFPGYSLEQFYMVKGTPIVNGADYQRTVEVLREQDPEGILVRVPGLSTGFMVEISRIL